MYNGKSNHDCINGLMSFCHKDNDMKKTVSCHDKSHVEKGDDGKMKLKTNDQYFYQVKYNVYRLISVPL
jgi:hypothetical protein